MNDKVPTPDEASAGRASILLVDDEPHILAALRRSLRKNPWQVHTAKSAAEGLGILERESIQVVISDYWMKGMDGIEFLNLVKARWPTIQRVMLTGHANIEAIERAINESEVFRFLNKPWHDSQLIATVTESLDRLRLIGTNKQYEEELAQRNAELLEINRDLEKKVQERTRALIQSEKMAALGRMSGGVAHEINNPLSGILAFAQVLLRDSNTYEQQTMEGLETIQSCALRCKNIVDNLLSFSRKSAGDDGTDLVINQVVQDALTIARLNPRAKQIQVRLDLGDHLPLVFGRAGLIEQVVVNLLQNAIHASAPAQEIVLRTRRVDEAVLVEVEDEGTGIPESVLPRVFEPFFTTKPTGEGTGLGLFICYGIAREHGGDLSVASQEGKGSTFTFSLPARAGRAGV